MESNLKNLDNPVISVVIPCRNEKDFIVKCLNSILSQENLPGGIEIIIVDGLSDDGTRELISNFMINYSNIRMIDNPHKVTPYALNIGIKNSKGNYITIMGAHAEYDSNFLSQSISLFTLHPEVACVGGPIISLGNNMFSEAVALAMSRAIGVGNAKHRFPDYEGYAEMACFPTFRKDIFDTIGYYDENLIKNQDDEFCFRLTRNGKKVFISPKVKSRYYVRNTPAGLFRQYQNYGFWRVAVIKKHKMPISLRQIIPTLFFIVLLGCFLLAIIFGNWLIGMTLPILYISALFLFSLKITLEKNQLSFLVNLPLAIFVLHFSYAYGFVKGLLKFT